MSKIVQVRKDGSPVQGLFRKVNTEGDAYRFVGAETGQAQIIHVDDDTVLSDGRSRVESGPAWPTPNGTPKYIDFVLKFKYLVGKNQLMVNQISIPSGFMRGILSREALEQARQDWAGWTNPPYDTILDPAGEDVRTFEEMADDVVRVYNPGQDKIFAFIVPHTSLQAVSRTRITVDNQGDNRAVVLLGEGDGIVFTSPNGRKGILRMNNALSIGIDPV
jgi:hypothetical protein